MGGMSEGYKYGPNGRWEGRKKAENTEAIVKTKEQTRLLVNKYLYSIKPI